MLGWIKRDESIDLRQFVIVKKNCESNIFIHRQLLKTF